MGNEAALKSSMVGLAVVMVVIWLWTQSLKKTCVTYAVGVCLIGGILLPDWDFFDRSFSRWPYPVTAEERAAALARKSHPSRFTSYVYFLADTVDRIGEECFKNRNLKLLPRAIVVLILVTTHLFGVMGLFSFY